MISFVLYIAALCLPESPKLVGQNIIGRLLEPAPQLIFSPVNVGSD